MDFVPRSVSDRTEQGTQVGQRGIVVPIELRRKVKTDWTGPDDYANAPPDYEEYVKQYFQYTRNVVQKAVASSDVDDVTDDIICRFIERDFLSEFNPELIVRSGTRPVFRSWYHRFVEIYSRGKYRNQCRLLAREQLICDRPVVGQEGEHQRWLEVFGPPTTLSHPVLAARASADRIAALVETILSQLPAQFHPLLPVVIEHGLAGPLNEAAIGKEMHLPQAWIHRGVNEIRRVAQNVWSDEMEVS